MSEKLIEITKTYYKKINGKWENQKQEVTHLSRERLARMTSKEEVAAHDGITGGKTTISKDGMTDVSPSKEEKVIWRW